MDAVRISSTGLSPCYSQRRRIRIRQRAVLHSFGRLQTGVEIPGLKWSPVKYRYPKWAGLYEENGKHINVNRGFGFLGFHGRVGIWPEITVLELKKATA